MKTYDDWKTTEPEPYDDQAWCDRCGHREDCGCLCCSEYPAVEAPAAPVVIDERADEQDVNF